MGKTIAINIKSCYLIHAPHYKILYSTICPVIICFNLELLKI